MSSRSIFLAALRFAPRSFGSTFALASAFLGFLGVGLRAQQDGTAPAPAAPTAATPAVAAATSAAAPLRLVIVGDSTVCNYPDNSPRRGWGQYIQGYFDSSVLVINDAINGQSTKTYIDEGHLQKALMDKPDILLIQFGHNDCLRDDPRSTDVETEYPTNLVTFINGAGVVHAKPILVTPMHFRKFDGAGKVGDALAPYVEVMTIVGSRKKVPVIDLYAASGSLFNSLGRVGTDKLGVPGDNIHFNEAGAKRLAAIVMQKLPSLDPRLRKALIASAPAKKK